MSQGGGKKNRARFARANFTLYARFARIKCYFVESYPPLGKILCTRLYIYIYSHQGFLKSGNLELGQSGCEKPLKWLRES